ncbi:hypothetical protein ACOMHN_022765 [Nucella lapillus]
MQLSVILAVLVMVVFARAQLQPTDPSHNPAPGPYHPAASDPNTQDSYPPTHEDQSWRHTPLDVLGIAARPGDNAATASRSTQTTNKVSRHPKSDRLSSLRSSVQHVLRATSFGEMRQQRIHDTVPESAKDASAKSAVEPSRQFLGWSENSGHYFQQNVQQAGHQTNGQARDPMVNPAQVPLVVAENGGSSNTHSDQESVTLSSILKDAFLEHNPNTLPDYFLGETTDQSRGDSAPDSAKVFSSSAYQLGGNPHLAKRVQESVPKDLASPNTSQQYAHNASELNVQERSSWRCSIPDVLVGDGDLPWTCHQRWAWRFLGEHVYPSRVYEAVCEGRTCWYGHFNCTPITYTLHVLELCLQGCQDQRVPYALRSFWQWTDLNVTVGCQCVR